VYWYAVLIKEYEYKRDKNFKNKIKYEPHIQGDSQHQEFQHAACVILTSYPAEQTYRKI
jgi:hypothetical protein